MDNKFSKMISKILNFTGLFVLIIGIISSLIYGFVFPETELGYYLTDSTYCVSVTLVGIIISVACGCILIGFSCILDYLDNIHKSINLSINLSKSRNTID